MRRAALLTLLLAFSVAAVATAGSDVDGLVRAFSWFKNKTWVATATEKQLIDTKRWSPSEGEPPVSVGEAIRLAEPMFKRLKADDDVDDTYWMLESVTLHPASPGNLPSSDDPEDLFPDERWYWEVWYQMYANTGASGDSLKLIVLMDGTVPEPTEFVPTPFVNPDDESPRIRGGSDAMLPKGNFYVLRQERPQGEIAVAAVYPYQVDLGATLAPGNNYHSGNGNSVSEWRESHTIRFAREAVPNSLDLEFTYDTSRKALVFRGRSIPLMIGQVAVIRFDRTLNPSIDVIELSQGSTKRLKLEMGDPIGSRVLAPEPSSM